jgi:hypothetical protein
VSSAADARRPTSQRRELGPAKDPEPVVDAHHDRVPAPEALHILDVLAAAAGPTAYTDPPPTTSAATAATSPDRVLPLKALWNTKNPLHTVARARMIPAVPAWRSRTRADIGARVEIHISTREAQPSR